MFKSDSVQLACMTIIVIIYNYAVIINILVL